MKRKQIALTFNLSYQTLTLSWSILALFEINSMSSSLNSVAVWDEFEPIDDLILFRTSIDSDRNAWWKEEEKESLWIRQKERERGQTRKNLKIEKKIFGISQILLFWQQRLLLIYIMNRKLIENKIRFKINSRKRKIYYITNESIYSSLHWRVFGL